MRHQGAFHFERADTVTAALDNVVGASHEPEITVLVFPGNVAGVVDVIVPCFMGAVGVSIIFFEQTERFAFVGADYNLSLFTGFYRTAVIVYQVYIVLRVRQSHAARLGLHPRHGGYGKGGFGLSEAFHQFDACQFPECIEYGGIQRFAGNGTILQ